MDVICLLIVFTYWTSTSLVEGWKWRIVSGLPDTCVLIDTRSYHVWRTVMGIAFVSLPFAPMANDLAHLGLATVAGWAWYERLMSFVEHDDFMVRRQPFEVMGLSFNRGAPIVEICVGALALVGYFLA